MFRNILQIRNGLVVGKRTFIKDTFKYSHCDPPPGTTPVCCGSPCCPPPPCQPPPCPSDPPRKPIPPNPCCPHFYEGGDKLYKRFRNIFLFVSLPLILLLTYKNVIAAPHLDEKGECAEFEFMLRRTKRFPWGDGTKSLFHSDKYNHLPGECYPPPPCDDDD